MRHLPVIISVALAIVFLSCNTPVPLADSVPAPAMTAPSNDGGTVAGHGLTTGDSSRIALDSVLEVVGGNFADGETLTSVSNGSTLVRPASGDDLVSAQGTTDCVTPQGGSEKIMQFCLTFEDTFGLNDVENLYFTVGNFDGALEVPRSALDITGGEMAKACFDAKLVGQLAASDSPVEDMGKLTGVGNAVGCVFYVTRGSGISSEFRTEIKPGQPCDTDHKQPQPTTPEPEFEKVEGCENDATLCDDGNACTEDECLPGKGCLRTHIDCDDGDECTEDACSPTEGCINTPIDCDDGDPCTEDSCSPTDGCMNTTINCDDGNACTEETCNPSLGCVSTPVNCDDSSACTEDVCDPVMGCVHNDIVCDDGLFCSGVETCDPVMGCISPGVSPCSAGQTCDEANDRCVSPALATADFCDDGVDPVSITFSFVGGSCSDTSHSQPAGLVDCTGLPITLPTARIIIADRSNLGSGGVRIYFDGTVTLGTTFTASAAIAGETILRAEAYFFIRDPLAALVDVQTGHFRADCEHPIEAGNQFGALRIVNVGF